MQAAAGRKGRLGLVIGVLAVLHGGDALWPGALDAASAQVTDRLFRLRIDSERFRPAYDGSVVHVDITDRTVSSIEGGYLTRRHDATLVAALAESAAQFHDTIYRAPLEPDQDAALIEATREAGNVYYGVALGLFRPHGEPVEGDGRPEIDGFRWRGVRVEGDASALPAAKLVLPTFPGLAGAARGLGFLDVAPDADGVYRRVALIARYGDDFFPSESLRVVCDVLGVTPDRVVVRPGDAIALEGARMPGESEPRTLEIPIDAAGRTVVNFLGPWERMQHHEMISILDDVEEFSLEAVQGDFEGKVAVVSMAVTGQADVGPTPIDPLYPRGGIHATVIHSALTESFLRELGPWRTFLAFEVPLVLLCLAAAAYLGSLAFTLSMLGLGAAAAGLGAWLFLGADRIVDLARPIAALGASTLALVAHQSWTEARHRLALRSVFDAYFPPSIVDKVMRRPERLTEMVQEKELTILFSDIVGFTSHSSRVPASQVQKLLNEYFEAMVDIVFKHGGTVDKFIGDGLMVFFGDPAEQEDHALRCVEAAREMQEKARSLHRDWEANGHMPLEIRIGINTGKVAVGNMGSERRVSYTVLGRSVNVAARLESAAPVGGILISKRTADLVDGRVPVSPLEPIRVKGIDEPLEVYEVPLAA